MSVENGYRREEIQLRTDVVPLLSLAGGVMAGLVLSEVIGIAGFLLPVFLAVAAYIVDMQVRHRST
jgi:uncharacterized membrane protein YoaK (UPF0700 family)